MNFWWVTAFKPTWNGSSWNPMVSSCGIWPPAGSKWTESSPKPGPKSTPGQEAPEGATGGTVVNGGSSGRGEGLVSFLWSRRGVTMALALQHLGMVVVSLGAAVLVAVPLGLLLERVRTEDALLTWHGEGLRGELYDLRADPDCLVNLWDAPEAAERQAELLHTLIRLMAENVDPLPVKEGPW